MFKLRVCRRPVRAGGGICSRGGGGEFACNDKEDKRRRSSCGAHTHRGRPCHWVSLEAGRQAAHIEPKRH
jgi:adenylosuccinate synthase